MYIIEPSLFKNNFSQSIIVNGEHYRPMNTNFICPNLISIDAIIMRSSAWAFWGLGHLMWRWCKLVTEVMRFYLDLESQLMRISYKPQRASKLTPSYQSNSLWFMCQSQAMLMCFTLGSCGKHLNDDWVATDANKSRTTAGLKTKTTLLSMKFCLI